MISSMIEKIVHTAKQTVNEAVLITSARVDSVIMLPPAYALASSLVYI
jgi:hypothetical protein